MENATQALLIAAGVLIGIIILSIAVYVFNLYAGHASDIYGQMEATEIAKFNNKFLKYSGLKDLTIQDIITVKNYALESNKKLDVNYNPSDNKYRAGDNNDYVDVYRALHNGLKYKLSSIFILDKSDETLLTTDINGGGTRFSCDIEINENTGRVNKIYFYPTSM